MEEVGEEMSEKSSCCCSYRSLWLQKLLQLLKTAAAAKIAAAAKTAAEDFSCYKLLRLQKLLKTTAAAKIAVAVKTTAAEKLRRGAWKWQQQRKLPPWQRRLVGAGATEAAFRANGGWRPPR